jgi:hypothetical protein
MNLFCVDTHLIGRLIIGVITNLPSTMKDESYCRQGHNRKMRATKDKVTTETQFLSRLFKEEDNDCKQ